MWNKFARWAPLGAIGVFSKNTGYIHLYTMPKKKTTIWQAYVSAIRTLFWRTTFARKTFKVTAQTPKKKKFARMERGYDVLRDEITSAENCQSVVQLRECMNLTAISTCDRRAESSNIFAAQVDTHWRGAQMLKTCVKDAATPCDAEKNAAAIVHLQKVLDAIVDLAWGI
ncbi:uncharacterized protein [Dermacentor andersoni]|uniref:uncharacterized protein n=1 Tax=Dermacentor andersoni TaxID=34620 RepID=UPI002155062B|nr:uncharacterized protein LOC126528363 [Dermacentor andersoni]